jgi:hypothetical protein
MSDPRTRLYKVTAADGHPVHRGTGRWDLPTRNPDGTWTPGAWREVEGPLEPCVNGLHLTRLEHLIGWFGPAIWVAEVDGETIEKERKVVARRARLIAGTAWDERAARHFAADCAEHVLHLVDPEWRLTLEVVLHTVRAHADGAADEEELAAAWAAAWDARDAAASDAQDATWAATWAAAWAATWATASDVWDAARSAAWNAARAAWNAARAPWDAQSERAWQADRLRAYLEGTA